METAGGITGEHPVSDSASRRERQEETEPVRVPAVDDDPNDLRCVRDALVQAGYSPVATGDPEEAVRLVEREKPRLALLDLMLPDTDGIELMQDIWPWPTCR